MTLPFFYIDHFEATQKSIVLNEETSKHVVQVLRMQKGEQINLADGKGNLLTTEIDDDHKKHCSVNIITVKKTAPASIAVSVAVSLIKNASRFEWFLEKATEIGIQAIIPLFCERTETQKFRSDRLKNILVSAMLQSQQTWLPELQEPTGFKQLVADTNYGQKFIAHCLDGQKTALIDAIDKSSKSRIILIGPEGDFTKAETEYAIQQGFIPVALGDTRLRTETAALVASTMLKLLKA